MKKISVLLIGLPNSGKSSFFNFITGRAEHIGNWSGKTVTLTRSIVNYKNSKIEIVDLPGTYSVFLGSGEEETTIESLLQENFDQIWLIIDAPRLSLGLRLFFEILEINNKVIIILTKTDRREINIKKLSEILGTRVFKFNGLTGEGIEEILSDALDFNDFTPLKPKYPENCEKVIKYESERFKNCEYNRFLAIRRIFKKYPPLSSFMDPKHIIMSHLLNLSKSIEKQVAYKHISVKNQLDRIILKTPLGILFTLFIFAFIFWLTLFGASPLSDLLLRLFGEISIWTYYLLTNLKSPPWVINLVTDGIIGGVGSIISVMLPTMSIFFSLFYLLEDSGLVPRIAFTVDKIFERCGTQGKHFISCMLSYGCNVPGVYSTKILDEKSKKIALITTNLNPCNGRWGPILGISLIIFGKWAFLVILTILIMSFVSVLTSSFFLSKIINRAYKPSFIIEMPEIKKPTLSKLFLRNFKQRVLEVTLRAVVVALPFSVLTWFSGFLELNGKVLNQFLVGILDPIGRFFNLTGREILSLIFALPAKEIVIASLFNLYGLGKGGMDTEGLMPFVKNLWSFEQGLVFIVLFAFYSPCLVTLVSIWREEKNLNLVFLSFLVSALNAIFWIGVYKIFRFLYSSL